MPKSCVVLGCSNHNMMDKNISFHIFPDKTKKKEKWEKWAQAMKRVNADGSPWYPGSKYVYVCSDHFQTGRPSKDPCHPDFLPNIFQCKKLDDGRSSMQLKRYESANKRARVKYASTNTSSEAMNVSCSTLEVEEQEPMKNSFQIDTNEVVPIVNRPDRSFSPSKAFISSAHLKPDVQYQDQNGEWHLIPGSLPSEYLSRKSLELSEKSQRRAVVYEANVEPQEKICYEKLGDIDRDLKYVKHPWLVLQRSEEQYIFVKVSPLGDIIVKILIPRSLDFKIYYHSALLPSSHHLHKLHLETTRIQWLIKEIEASKECEGICDKELVKFGHIPSKDTAKKFYKHVDPKILLEEQTTPILYSTCVRSCECLFLSDASTCGPCKTVKKYLRQKLRIENNVRKIASSLSTPLYSAGRSKLKTAVILGRANEKV